MKVHDDYKEGWNVDAQVNDPESVWTFWQTMLQNRKKYEALVYGMSPLTLLIPYVRLADTCPGSFIPLDESNNKTYSYIRDDKTIGQKLLVVLNFARTSVDKEGYYHGEKSTVQLPKDLDVSNAKLIVTNGEAKEGSGIEGSSIELGEWEGRIYLL